MTDGIRYIVCVGSNAISHRINVDMECETRGNPHVIAVTSEADFARRVFGLFGEIAFVQMGIMSTQLRTYLQAMRAPELGSVAARRLLRKIMENTNG